VVCPKGRDREGTIIEPGQRLLALARRTRGWLNGLPLVSGLLLAGLLGLLLAGSAAYVLLRGAAPVDIHLLAPMRWGEAALLV
jgi:hypothetical protein